MQWIEITKEERESTWQAIEALEGLSEDEKYTAYRMCMHELRLCKDIQTLIWYPLWWFLIPYAFIRWYIERENGDFGNW
jgi:hypothetical protein